MGHGTKTLRDEQTLGATLGVSRASRPVVLVDSRVGGGGCCALGLQG